MEAITDILKDYQQVPKVWGREYIACNTPLFCCKALQIEEDKQCSLHQHVIKSEFFLIVAGHVAIEIGATVDTALASYHTKIVGDCIYVPAGTWHRFGALDGPATILEISSHHEDSDIVRAQASGSIFPF